MLISPFALSNIKLDRETLSSDLSSAKDFENCCLSRRAVYLGYYIFKHSCYIPLQSIQRVYKRLAVSKGYFEGNVYGTLAYLVVEYDNGKKSVCRFKREENVDSILEAFRRETKISIGKK